MKRPSIPSATGFTLLELIAVIAILAILLAMILPANRPCGSHRVACMSNLKQIGVGFWVWASDHGDKFPWQISTNGGGTLEWSESLELQPHLRVFHSTSVDPRVLVCPMDHRRQPAVSMASLSSSNLSYFLVLGAEDRERPTASVLMGDRNIEIGGVPVRGRVVVGTANLRFNWSAENIHVGGGNLLFLDGHVDFVKTQALTSVMSKLPLAGARVIVP